MRPPYNSDLFTNVDAKDFAVVVINARISSCVQNTFVRDRVVVGGRSVEIVHLKFFSVYADDVAFGVTGLRLLMQHFNWSLHDFILFIVVGVHQFVDMAKYVGKKMQVKPSHAPNQNERRTDVIFHAVSASPVPDKQPQTSEESRDANQQPENFIAKNAVTISRDLKNGDELRHG